MCFLASVVETILHLQTDIRFRNHCLIQVLYILTQYTCSLLFFTCRLVFALASDTFFQILVAV